MLALGLNVDSVELFGIFNRNPSAQMVVQNFYQKSQAYLEGLGKYPDSIFRRRDTTMHIRERAVSYFSIDERNKKYKAQTISHQYQRIQTRIIRNGQLVSNKTISDSGTRFERRKKRLPYRSDSVHQHMQKDTELIIIVRDSVSLSNSFDSLGKITTGYRNQLDSLQREAILPIGIHYSVFNRKPPKSFAFWMLKSFGILISGIAASMGAPFWFDLLKKMQTPKSK